MSSCICATRRESGGDDLRDAVTTDLGERIATAEAAGMVRLFSVRHEFPSAWAKFITTKIDTTVKTAELSLDLRPEHYPFWSRDRLQTVQQATVIARVSDDIDEIAITENADATGDSEPLTRPTDDSLGSLLVGTLDGLAPASPVCEPSQPFKLYFESTAMTDLWLAIAWKGTA